MQRLTTVKKGVFRILDANINRLKEGLRVCEEITRFVVGNKPLSFGFKAVRHKVDVVIKSLSRQEYLKERNIAGDIGRGITLAAELKRNDCQEVFAANIQRVKEATRVLEEFSKLFNTTAALKFKKIRYDIYELEKKTTTKLSALRYRR